MTTAAVTTITSTRTKLPAVARIAFVLGAAVLLVVSVKREKASFTFRAP
jgi:hypothetical protein